MNNVVRTIKDRELGREDLYPVNCAMRILSACEAFALLVNAELLHDATSAVRAAFEAVVSMLGFFRIPNFVDRRHVDFLNDQRELLNKRIQFGSYEEGETEADIQKLIAQVDAEADEYARKGMKKIEKVSNIAQMSGLMRAYLMYYKLLSLDTHINSTMLQDYVDRRDTTFGLVDRPGKAEDWEYLSEALTNFLLISISLLNEKYALGMKMRTVDEYIADLHSPLRV
jgi:hypothetical protein